MAFGFVNIFLAAGVMLAVTFGLYGQTAVLGSVAYKSHLNTDAMLDAISGAEN
jgi:hypothetical protein